MKKQIALILVLMLVCRMGITAQSSSQKKNITYRGMSGYGLLPICRTAMKVYDKERPVGLTGEEISRDMTSCIEYIAGSVDTYAALSDTEIRICFPDNFNSEFESHVRIVYKYLTNHPEKLQGEAVVLI